MNAAAEDLFKNFSLLFSFFCLLKSEYVFGEISSGL